MTSHYNIDLQTRDTIKWSFIIVQSKCDLPVLAVPHALLPTFDDHAAAGEDEFEAREIDRSVCSATKSTSIAIAV